MGEGDDEHDGLGGCHGRAQGAAAPGSERHSESPAAEQHVYEHGFSATTLDAILDVANASKGAFFHHFESKEALGEVLLARYAERDGALLDEFMSDAEADNDDPGEQVIAFLRAFEEAAGETDTIQPGCLFVSFINERGPGVRSEDDVIVGSIEYWRDRILDKLEKAAADHVPTSGSRSGVAGRPSVHDLRRADSSSPGPQTIGRI